MSDPQDFRNLLQYYRESMSDDSRDILQDFTLLPLEDQVEYLMHMLQNVVATVRDLAAALDMDDALSVEPPTH